MSEFEKIQEAALLEATKVKCSFEDYVKGLEEMADLLNERLALAHEELEEKRQQAEGERE